MENTLKRSELKKDLICWISRFDSLTIKWTRFTTAPIKPTKVKILRDAGKEKDRDPIKVMYLEGSKKGKVDYFYDYQSVLFNATKLGSQEVFNQKVLAELERFKDFSELVTNKLKKLLK